MAESVNERMIQRINASLPRIQGEDRRVLDYIRQELTPAAIERRQEWDRNVSHLHEVAISRLKIHERRAQEELTHEPDQS